MSNNKSQKAEIGMVGLGVMGRNMLLNIAEHGFRGVGYDKDPQKVDQLKNEARELPVQGAYDVASFIDMLQTPRAIMLLVPAGPIVDSVIRDLLPHLGHDDLIIDAGNSHYTDTDLREKTLEAKGFNFIGMGVSGGEEGARNGPSMMPGGPEAAYNRVKPIMEATAAQVNGEPCVTYLGPHSAGHYVKMVHNGIEYGMMQLIAESYDFLLRGLEKEDNEIGDIFEQWNKTDLSGYLIEITANILHTLDTSTGKPLVGLVLDAAKQLGTGRWASQDAMSLTVPTPTIDVSVSMRNLSGLQSERAAIGERYGVKTHQFSGDQTNILEKVRSALYAAVLLTYTQGFAQMATASQAYSYNLDLAAVARIWRGGCIIRSSLLEIIRNAYTNEPKMPNLLIDGTLGDAVIEHLPNLRWLVQATAEICLPAPAFMASLAYIDSLRSIHLPANLIQAQRDYFGAHTYERVDKRGVFHTQWSREEELQND